MKNLYITTFGCQMNKRDSERIAGLLEKMEYRLTEDKTEADLIIINTCSIRDKAEQKVYSVLGKFNRLKENNPNLILGVGGCVAQQEGEKLLRRVSCLDMVFGTHSLHLLPGIIRKIEGKRARVCKTTLSDSIDPEDSFVSPNSDQRIKAYVTIMQGCDNYCSYCIVPHVRGREVSRKSADIAAEIQGLADKGIKEVTLLGQNVNSYGKRDNSGVSFPALLKKIAGINGIERIRFTTSNPRDLSRELIRSFAEIEKLCNHIHLPIQSGSNRILKRMNRQYTRDTYIEKVLELRSLNPDIGLTTDIIVGFPGETEEDFKETIELLKEIEFDNIYSFKFSPRPETAAACFNDQVSEDIKSERLFILQGLQKRITEKKSMTMEGKVCSVLVEGRSKRKHEELTGRTLCNRVVNFKGATELIGEIITIRIKKCSIPCTS
ncbi:MAG: tRNA (N6-isopentenyl adenosine(37)-C2)-methylthiotransferase MiaB [Thermodesulfobacteriota bacterium]